MKTVTLNIGGQLATGDVVGIAYNNCVQFAWFVEAGQYGSLKYISFSAPITAFERYTNYVNGVVKGPYWDRTYAKGFVFKNIGKEYIVKFTPVDNRAFKIGNPEEFFKGAGDTEVAYLKSKEILNNLKFPAK